MREFVLYVNNSDEERAEPIVLSVDNTLETIRMSPEVARDYARRLNEAADLASENNFLRRIREFFFKQPKEKRYI